ncbi:MAG: hypothetical protein II166_01115, partial [Firmicutes bacterium]|nr:hypothetical protein [Bacillota bacterium]
SRIVSEKLSSAQLIYAYDENGQPIGFTYRRNSDGYGVEYKFFFNHRVQRGCSKARRRQVG